MQARAHLLAQRGYPEKEMCELPASITSLEAMTVLLVVSVSGIYWPVTSRNTLSHAPHESSK